MPEDWRKKARCKKLDPELFFPVGEMGPAIEQRRQAKAECGRCPVLAECLTWALENPALVRDGIWGGLDEDQRRARREQRSRTKVRTP